MQLFLKPMKVEAEKQEKTRSSERVREHLANERTYLAWMRTAIALMGFGVVIVRIQVFRPPLLTNSGNSWKLGLFFSLIGLVTVSLSTQHYFAVRHDINEDTYKPADRWVILLSLAVLLLGTGVIYFVFATTSSPMSVFVPE